MASKTNSFFKGISVQTLITIVMGILEMVVFAIMSRLLSKEDFGYYAALTGTIAICLSISEAGLGSAVIQKKDATPSHISTAFTLSLLVGTVCSLLVFVLAPLLANLVADKTLIVPIRIMSASLLLNSIISVGRSQLLRSLKFKRIGVIQCISYIISSLIGIVMAFWGFGLMSIVIYNFLNSLLFAILIYATSLSLPRIGINKKEVSGILSFGGWLTLGVILNNITHQLDKLFMSKWLSVESLGAYNRPAGFTSQISGKVNGIFDTVLFPMLSDMQENQEKVISVFYKAVGLLNSFSAILSCVFFFNADLIITIFFGNQWQDLVPIMRIVSIGIIFNIDGRLVDCFFRSLNYVQSNFYLRLVGAVLTFLLLYIGSMFDIIGIAVGLVSANILMIILKMVVLCRKIRANIISMFIAWFCAWKPVLPIAIIGTIYIFFIPKTIASEVIFALLFAFIFFLEFIIYPQMVSKEYCAIIDSIRK